MERGETLALVAGVAVIGALVWLGRASALASAPPVAHPGKDGDLVPSLIPGVYIWSPEGAEKVKRQFDEQFAVADEVLPDGAIIWRLEPKNAATVFSASKTVSVSLDPPGDTQTVWTNRPLTRFLVAPDGARRSGFDAMLATSTRRGPF